MDTLLTDIAITPEVVPEVRNDDALMVGVEHIDFLDNKLGSKFRNDSGVLKGEAVVTNIGVFSYMNPNGTMRHELRHPDDVFQKESMDSLRDLPFTIHHPTGIPISKPQEYWKFAKGRTGQQPRHDAYHIAIPITIDHQDGIAAVRGGIKNLSAGYVCDLVREDGVYLGSPYTHRQKNIRYHHVAAVHVARAGDAARIHTDSMDANVSIQIVPNKENDMDMQTIRIDGADFQADPHVIAALTVQTQRADGLQTDLDALKTAKSTIEAERDTFKSRADSAVAELETLKKSHVDSAELPALVKARVQAEAIAVKAGVQKADSLSDAELKLAVIKAKQPTLHMDGKDAAYTQAAYDLVVASMASEGDAASRLPVKPVSNADGCGAGSGKPDLEASRKKMQASLGAAWQKK